MSFEQQPQHQKQPHHHHQQHHRHHSHNSQSLILNNNNNINVVKQNGSASPPPPLSNVNNNNTNNSLHYNVPHRRSSITTAPYTIPSKNNTSNGNGVAVPQQLSGSYNRSSNMLLSSTAPAASAPAFGMSSSPHTGGPIHHSHLHGSIQQQQQQQQQQQPMLSREFVVRRISEGETGRLKEELKCEACGKGYKHISSLAKHLWEHTPEWNMTKKLLISKHQQVQLLEAASILCSMTENGTVVENGGFRSRSVSFSTPPPLFTQQVQQHVQQQQAKQQAQLQLQLQQQQLHQQHQQHSQQPLQQLNKGFNFGPSRQPLHSQREASMAPKSEDSAIDNSSSSSPLSDEEVDSTPNSSSGSTSTPTSTSTSTTAASNPMYTTVLRKNSVSQYPPSSIQQQTRRASLSPFKESSSNVNPLNGSNIPQYNFNGSENGGLTSTSLHSTSAARRDGLLLIPRRINEEDGEYADNESAVAGSDDEDDDQSKRQFVPTTATNSNDQSNDDDGVFGEMDG